VASIGKTGGFTGRCKPSCYTARPGLPGWAPRLAEILVLSKEAV
jgi:hypothetical protein